MSDPANSPYSKAVHALTHSELSDQDCARILFFMTGYMEGNDDWRNALVREVEYYKNRGTRP